MADHPNLILQLRIEDGLSPFLKAFNDALPRGGGAPPMPKDVVFVEQRAHSGGGSIRVLPSTALLTWMGEVMERHRVHYEGWEARRSARLAGEALPS